MCESIKSLPISVILVRFFCVSWVEGRAVGTGAQRAPSEQRAWNTATPRSGGTPKSKKTTMICPRHQIWLILFKKQLPNE